MANSGWKCLILGGYVDDNKINPLALWLTHVNDLCYEYFPYYITTTVLDLTNWVERERERKFCPGRSCSHRSGCHQHLLFLVSTTQKHLGQVGSSSEVRWKIDIFWKHQPNISGNVQLKPLTEKIPSLVPLLTVCPVHAAAEQLEKQNCDSCEVNPENISIQSLQHRSIS